MSMCERPIGTHVYRQRETQRDRVTQRETEIGMGGVRQRNGVASG